MDPIRKNIITAMNHAVMNACNEVEDEAVEVALRHIKGKLKNAAHDAVRSLMTSMSQDLRMDMNTIEFRMTFKEGANEPRS